jgi:hypothetical protein
MIDFKNAEYLKLKPVDPANFTQMLSPMFVDGEEVLGVFQSVRDGIMFTNKRIFAVNVQGISGKKKDFTSLPYSKIQGFSVELWFSGLGRVKFEFVARADVAAICKNIGGLVLS